MILKTVFFSSILLLALTTWNFLGPEEMRSHSAYFIIFYFAVSNTLIHRYLIGVNKVSPKRFVTVYMGSTALRLFLNLIIILLAILIDRPQAMVFTLSFLLFYFAFLIFEIASLQSELKKK